MIRTDTPRPVVMERAGDPRTDAALMSDHDPDGSRFFRGLCWAVALTGFGFGAIMALFYLAALVVLPLALLLRDMVS